VFAADAVNEQLDSPVVVNVFTVGVPTLKLVGSEQESPGNGSLLQKSIAIPCIVVAVVAGVNVTR
jgi:hypothetical protein